MKKAEEVIARTPQVKLDGGTGIIYWQKSIIARHDRKTDGWQRTAAWNDAIGIDWSGLQSAMEKQD